VPVRDVVGRLIAMSGRQVEPDVQGTGTPHGEIDRQFLDSGAMEAELGWHASWDLDRGLAAAWDWYRERLGSR
jgi:CDP-glucose 4,6-dehydratase